MYFYFFNCSTFHVLFQSTMPIMYDMIERDCSTFNKLVFKSHSIIIGKTVWFLPRIESPEATPPPRAPRNDFWTAMMKSLASAPAPRLPPRDESGRFCCTTLHCYLMFWQKIWNNSHVCDSIIHIHHIHMPNLVWKHSHWSVSSVFRSESRMISNDWYTSFLRSVGILDYERLACSQKRKNVL